MTKARERLIGYILIALSLGFLISGLSKTGKTNRDFISYWATGQQFVHHANPYGSEAVFRIEKENHYEANTPFLMRNPPFALFLTIPLGLLPESFANVLWSLIIIGALIVSVQLTRRLFDPVPERLHLVGYCFAPILACIFSGQLGIIILLGMTLFLYLHQSRPWLAGASLLLCVIKPHLFLPFFTAFLLWIVVSKRWKILCGLVAAVLASSALSFCFDPSAWTQYEQMLRSSRINQELIPTFGFLVRLAIDRRLFWIQFVPACLGSLWAAWYFWTRRRDWSWTDHGMLLLLVSIFVAPYAWFSDESVLFPAILVALIRVGDRLQPRLVFGVAAAIALVEVFCFYPLSSAAYIWTPLAWLAWYLYAVHVSRPTSLPSGSEMESA